MLKINEIYKDHIQGGNTLSIIKGLDFEIKEGETIAILGKSGSGKSTLLSLMSGLLQVDKGEIEFLGKRFTQLTEQELADFRAGEMGIIFQQFHLLPHLNALENVMLPLEMRGDNQARSKSSKMLEEFGLGDRKDHFPSQLSGGEAQRVAIARAMVINPKLMLADEPSGSLDEETGDYVMNQLFEMVQKYNMSLILVTHNKDLAKKCSKVMQLEHGKLHEI